MELRQRYKQTEFGTLPTDWELRPLGALAPVVTGNTPPTRNPTSYGDEFLFVSPGDIGSTKHISRTEKMLSSEGFSLSRPFPIGSILFVCIGSTIGKCGIAGQPLTSNQQINAVLPSPEVSSEYLYYALCARANSIKSLAGEQAVPIVNKTQFSETTIPLPPTRAEQEAIAEVLSDADALIESLEQLLAKKRQLKQGAMQELLTGKKRLPGFSGEWEVKRLGDIARIQRGASPRPIDSPVWFDENSSIGWVRISDVTSSGMFLFQTTQRLSPLGVKSSRPVASGSLIMSICATVGRPVVTKIDVCIHDGFVVFDYLEANQLFVYYVLKWIEPDWSKHGQTGSQMNLNTGLISNTSIKLPPCKEQTAIATILSDMDVEIDALDARLAKAGALKQGMMQELLTGAIRLPC